MILVTALIAGAFIVFGDVGDWGLWKRPIIEMTVGDLMIVLIFFGIIAGR